MKISIKLVIILSILLTFWNCSSSVGETVAEEVCDCFSALEVSEDQMTSIEALDQLVSPEKAQAFMSCVKSAMDKAELNGFSEEDQLESRVVLREKCPKAAELMGL